MRAIWVRRGLEWIAAFDQIPLVDILHKLRELDLFTEKELEHHYAIGIERRLWRIFGPDVVPAAKPKTSPKPPRAVKRISVVEKKKSSGDAPNCQWCIGLQRGVSNAARERRRTARPVLGHAGIVIPLLQEAAKLCGVCFRRA